MSKIKKITSIALSLLIIFSTILSTPVNAKAKENNNYISIMHKINTARQNFPIRYNFSLEKEADIYFELAINERTTLGLDIKNQKEEVALIYLIV